ncbi:MAG: hypothetical protein K1X67_09025 [Fimbriimonadaceae bacterium]|nr:hypothetical protein [Fimbriimonadaceae bacterium]
METSPRSDAARLDHRSYVLEVLLAIVLGLSTVGAAYAAYQASRYDGNALAAYSESLAKTNDTNAAELRAAQRLTMDMLGFNQFKALQLATAQAKTPADQQTVYAISVVFQEESFSGTFAKAVQWSEDEYEKKKQVVSPADYEPYVKELEAPALAIRKERESALDDARSFGDLGDQFTLMTVLFTIVLFFTGIAAVFKRDPVKITLLVAASVLLVATAARLFTLPPA